MRPGNFIVMIGALSRPTMPAFSALFTLEPLHRAVISTVIPVVALEHFGNARNVSVFYFALGALGVCMSMGVPWLVSRVRRRGTFYLGAISGITAMILFMTGDVRAFCLAMALHLFAASCIDVSLNLYMMEHVRRQDFGRFEPIRMFFLAFSWCIGPFLGVWLRNAIHEDAPYLFCIGTVTALALYFFYLRFVDHPAVATRKPAVTNPLLYLPRFFRQPRLRLVYVLSLMRSGWWTMYFIYIPIYCVTAGLGETTGGALVSLATAFVMGAPLLRPVIARIGIGRLLFVGYFATGMVTVLLSQILDAPSIAIPVMLLAGLCAVPCDAVGNALFYRAVHPYERSEMATVFGSYRSVGSLTFPGVYSGILAVFPLAGVFFATGIGMVWAATLTRFIPRRMR